MHNLSTVFKFEVIRTIKKKSFWLMALSFPVIIAAVFAVIFFSGQATTEISDKMKDEKFSILITDESKLISPALAEAYGAKYTTDKTAAINSVKNGSVDAYFYYPENLSKKTAEVYGKDVGLFDNSRYTTVAELLLKQSAAHKVEQNTMIVLQEAAKFDSTTYRDGEVYDGLKQAIAPGIFLVLFYFIIAMFSNQMLTSTTEEKENRVIEMMLTTLSARTLIIGKILALIVLALSQSLILVIPGVIGYILMKDSLALPAIDLATIPFDAWRISAAVAITAASFMFVTGLLVAIGAATPTAKEASSFSGIVIMGLFIPLYAVTLFVSSPDSPIVRFLTFFPLTAPVPGLLRNAVGNLSVLETVAVIGIMSVSAIVVIALAIRIFQYGTIEYSKRLSLKTMFKSKTSR